jgi:hypothetical protein
MMPQAELSDEVGIEVDVGGHRNAFYRARIDDGVVLIGSGLISVSHQVPESLGGLAGPRLLQDCHTRLSGDNYLRPDDEIPQFIRQLRQDGRLSLRILVHGF